LCASGFIICHAGVVNKYARLSQLSKFHKCTLNTNFREVFEGKRSACDNTLRNSSALKLHNVEKYYTVEVKLDIAFNSVSKH